MPGPDPARSRHAAFKPSGMAWPTIGLSCLLVGVTVLAWPSGPAVRVKTRVQFTDSSGRWPKVQQPTSAGSESSSSKAGVDNIVASTGTDARHCITVSGHANSTSTRVGCDGLPSSSFAPAALVYIAGRTRRKLQKGGDYAVVFEELRASVFSACLFTSRPLNFHIFMSPFDASDAGYPGCNLCWLAATCASALPLNTALRAAPVDGPVARFTVHPLGPNILEWFRDELEVGPSERFVLALECSNVPSGMPALDWCKPLVRTAPRAPPTHPCARLPGRPVARPPGRPFTRSPACPPAPLASRNTH